MATKLSQVGRKVFLPLFLGGWMVSCSPLNPLGWAQDYLDIAKLEEISNQSTVTVQGIVVNVAPFLEGGAYQIQDKTGRVWVKTDGPLPKKGTVLSVKAEVAYEPIFIGQEKLGESYLLQITAPQPTTTANTQSTAGPNPTASTATSNGQNGQDSGATSPAAPTNLPPQGENVGINTISVANPEAPRPIANSVPNPAPARPNVDDQFLPHKRLAK